MMILVTILCYFAVLLLIARITGRKGGSNAAFFKGENQSPWYIVSFGMIGASISGVTFVSVPGMVRGMDMTYMQTVLGFFFGYMTVAHILLPLYYKLNLTSIYGYLGTRIGVRAYRTGSFFFLLSRMLGTAAKLYLVCLILHTYVFQEMHVPFWLIAVGSVALVWIYTHKSGIKTIVWTDTLQTFCLIAALIFIIYFTIQRLDLNFSGIVQTIQNSEHSRIFVFDDWVSRQNFFKQFFSGISFNYAGSEVSIAAKGYVKFVEFFIRKAAHFTTYFILGGSLYLGLLPKLKQKSSVLGLAFAWLAATGYAATNEFHQMLTGGRTPLFQDVMLDSCGALTACLLIILVHKLRGKR